MQEQNRASEAIVEHQAEAHLSLAKMPSGVNALEINDIQEAKLRPC